MYILPLTLISFGNLDILVDAQKLLQCIDNEIHGHIRL